jgi:trehalose/maltose hydrolase-like predicted phosphorylase
MEPTFWLNKSEITHTLRHYGERTLNAAKLRAKNKSHLQRRAWPLETLNFVLMGDERIIRISCLRQDCASLHINESGALRYVF